MCYLSIISILYTCAKAGMSKGEGSVRQTKEKSLEMGSYPLETVMTHQYKHLKRRLTTSTRFWLEHLQVSHSGQWLSLDPGPESFL